MNHNYKNFKKIILIISIIALVTNCTTLFAQTLEVEVLGGGYKLKGPAFINFGAASTSLYSSASVVNFRDLATTNPGETNNFLDIIDENGGNPFDVTVSGVELKKDVTLSTLTIAGSTNSTINAPTNTPVTILKVVYAINFHKGDLVKVGDDNTTLTVESVSTNDNTLTVSPQLSVIPDENKTVSRFVDCDFNPKECIAYNNFSIQNQDFGVVNPNVDIVNDLGATFTLNNTTNDFQPIGAESTVLDNNSTTTVINVTDASTFNDNEEITFVFGKNHLENATIASRDINASPNTITLTTPLSIAPIANMLVHSATSRILTLGSGDGITPGEFKIYPTLRSITTQGQIPGSYTGSINITIV